MLGNNTREEIEKRLQIVASAGNLSRADGTVTEVFESNNDYDKNLRLARAVVGYGHKSIAEHDYLVFALENVTPIVEQTLIEYRLTSFTIKSRRNVDFRNVGFYVPDFKDKDGNILENNEELKKKYIAYNQSLFNKYGDLVDEGIPVEDCRYILPYSYYSNIIMGCDANELLRITTDLLYGKNSHITELHELGEKFAEMIREKVPYLSRALDKEVGKKYYEDLGFIEVYKNKCEFDKYIFTTILSLIAFTSYANVIVHGNDARLQTPAELHIRFSLTFNFINQFIGVGIFHFIFNHCIVQEFYESHSFFRKLLSLAFVFAFILFLFFVFHQLLLQ